MLKSFHEGTN